MRLLKLYPIFILIQASILGQASDTKVIDDIEFQPHMIEHIIKGCPENSDCNKETGAISENFKTVFNKHSLKKQQAFVAKYGLPFKFWTTQLSDKLTITYQSKCNLHKPKKDNRGNILIDRKPIFEGIRFIRNVNELTKSDYLLPNKMIREDGMQVQIIPRGTIPYFTNGDESYYQLDYRDIDFNMKIKNGKITLATRDYPEVETRAATCSQDLIRKFTSLYSEKIFQTAYCKSIYDIKDKKYYLYIFGWSC